MSRKAESFGLGLNRFQKIKLIENRIGINQSIVKSKKNIETTSITAVTRVKFTIVTIGKKRDFRRSL